MKRYFSKLTLALIVALVMSLGIAGVAMATGPAVGTGPHGRVNIGITKELDIPVGTTVPAANFHFDIEQMVPHATIDGAWVVGSTTPPATIPNVDIAFAAGNVGGFETTATPGMPVAQATDILENATWPHAGDFKFLVTERHTAPTTQFTSPEYMTYSTAQWVMIVRVANVEYPVGSGTYLLVPTQAFFVAPTEGTDGTDPFYTWNEEAKRNDLTPGEPGTGGDDGRLLDPSGIRFINTFTRDIDGTLVNPALAISKTITGQYADRTTMFTFNGTLVVPAAAVDRVDGEVIATVVDSDGVPVIPGRTATFTGTGATLTGSFTLGNGETLAFPRLPAGTTFNVTETQQENWRGRAEVTLGAASTVFVPGPAASNWATIGANVSTDTRIVSDARGPAPAYAFLGNTADFTNDYVAPPLTGLVIGSMPFLAALLGATLLLAMMVASRSRQRIEQMPVSH
ncbi:MAG: hypothetical protein FWE26_01145 [Coriobacteriia bacterium]|nr:hypothetical protein [Coriobacteriia bacterium]